MPRPKGIPAYRRHKARDLAKVRIDGRDVYLGKHGSPESRAEYDRVIAEFLARRGVPAVEPEQRATASVNRLILAYLTHAHDYYRGRDGRPTQELANLKDALRPVRRLYGPTPAVDFGPVALEAVRAEMVRSGLARTTVNARVHRVRRAFRWAVSREMIPPSVVQALDSVAALAKNRTEAPEPPPVLPVPPELLGPVLPLLPRAVAAMVRLQLLTAMRAGEVLAMRGGRLEAGSTNWEYRPDHKGEWRDKGRVVLLGPKAQAIVREFLGEDPAAPLFTTGKGPYDRRTYRQAIVRACDRAFPPPGGADVAAWRSAHRWCPLRLRHTAATAIRARYGLEASQVVLGHARADVTQVYAERDLAKAAAIMAEIG